MGWVAGWSHKKKLVINRNVVSGTLTNIPLAFRFDGQDYNDIVNVIRRYNFSEGTIADTHNFGSDNEGYDGLSTLGSPELSNNYIAFNGTNNGLYASSDWGDNSNLAVHVRFRLRNKNKGSAQVLWKDGGYSNGFAVGLDASNNLGVFARSSGALTSITIPNSKFEENIWYDLYASKTRVVLLKTDGTLIAYKTGFINPANGSDPESVGVAYSSSPLSGSTSTSDYFDGDIDFVYIFSPESNIKNPVDDSIIDVLFKDGNTTLSYELENKAFELDDYITFFIKIPSISGTYDKLIDMYYGNPNVSGTIYTPTQVWSSNEHMGVYHFASDGIQYDSTSGNYDFGSTYSYYKGPLTVTSGVVGTAVIFDGTDDGVGRSSTMQPDDQGVDGEAMCLVVFRTTTSGQQGIFWKEGGTGQGWGIGFDNGKIKLGESGNNRSVLSTSDQYHDGNWHCALAVFDESNGVELFVDGISQGTDGVPLSIGTSLPAIGRTNFGGSAQEPIWESTSTKAFNGAIDELRIYKSIPTTISGYAYTLYQNLINNATFFTVTGTLSLFSNPYPYNTTVYGKTQQLKITPNTDGELSTYTLNFYNKNTNQLVSTVSGTDNNEVTTSGITWSGGENVWYVTISGLGNSDYYDFLIKYMCSGTVEVDGVTTSGILIRLYNRVTGDLIGSTVSSGNGEFSIISDYDDAHFIIAYYGDDSRNALIYDWVIPE